MFMNHKCNQFKAVISHALYPATRVGGFEVPPHGVKYEDNAETKVL